MTYKLIEPGTRYVVTSYDPSVDVEYDGTPILFKTRREAEAFAAFRREARTYSADLVAVRPRQEYTLMLTDTERDAVAELLGRMV